MQSIDEMLDALKGRRTANDPKFEAIIEFIESLKDHVVFCTKCKKVRLDPGMELTINGKQVELCESCLDTFLGKMAPHAEEVEYELEDGTTLKSVGRPGSGLMTVHEPDPDPHPAAMFRPDNDYEPHDPWATSRERAKKEGVEDQVFSNDGEGPPK